MGTSAAKHAEWLSLQKASERLGVTPATLRIWADRGRIPAYRTPGGHRRFRERDVTALTTVGDKSSSGEPMRILAHAALGLTRLGVSEGRLAEEAWYRRFPPGAREEHRELGRKVVLTLSGLNTSSDAEAQFDSKAMELGKAYGQLNHKYEIAMADSLRAFLFFRDMFMESLVELAGTSAAFDILLLMRRTTRFVDRMLLTMVESSNAPFAWKKRTK